MKKHQDARRIATGNHGIFARHAVHIDGSEFHVVCNGPNSTNLVESVFALQANQPAVAWSSVARGQHRFRFGPLSFLCEAAEAIIEQR